MDDESDIYEGLRLRVTSGGLTPNTKLKPSVLRHDYNCSASTIREALFRLSTVGLVSFQEQRGFRVPIPTDQAQHELTHLRILLECEGACLSIRQGGIDWESRLTAAHHNYRISKKECVEALIICRFSFFGQKPSKRFMRLSFQIADQMCSKPRTR